MLSGGFMAQSLMSTLSSPKKRMEKNLSKALESQDLEDTHECFSNFMHAQCSVS